LKGRREVWRRLDELVGCIARKRDAGHPRPLVELILPKRRRKPSASADGGPAEEGFVLSSCIQKVAELGLCRAAFIAKRHLM
jgi:hypothetical protein